jgi:hypothetical protein
MEAKTLHRPPDAKALPAPNAKTQCDELISQLKDLTALITTQDPGSPQDAAPPEPVPEQGACQSSPFVRETTSIPPSPDVANSAHSVPVT